MWSWLFWYNQCDSLITAAMSKNLLKRKNTTILCFTAIGLHHVNNCRTKNVLQAANTQRLFFYWLTQMPPNFLPSPSFSFSIVTLVPVLPCSWSFLTQSLIAILSHTHPHWTAARPNGAGNLVGAVAFLEGKGALVCPHLSNLDTDFHKTCRN